MSNYQMIADSGRKSTYTRRRQLAGSGYQYDSQKKKWSKPVSPEEIKDESHFLKRLGLRAVCKDLSNSRSADYRKKYFNSHNPDIFGRYYHCAYCGKILSKDRATIDHIIPVGKAISSGKVRRSMRRHGINNVNDTKNLTVACAQCNRRKAARTGYWVPLGFLGSSPWFWPVAYPAIFSLFIYLIVIVHHTSAVISIF